MFWLYNTVSILYDKGILRVSWWWIYIEITLLFENKFLINDFEWFLVETYGPWNFKTMYSTNNTMSSNHTNSGTNILVLNLATYIDPAASSDYNTVKIVCIFIGTPMTFRLVYGIWGNGSQWIGAYDNPDIS